MTSDNPVDLSVLAEAVDFHCPFFATRDAIQVAELGEGDVEVAFSKYLRTQRTRSCLIAVCPSGPYVCRSARPHYRSPSI